MSGDLSLFKYRGTPPARNKDIQVECLLTLGTVGEVKAILEKYIPKIEWEIEPSLLSIMQQSGSELWKSWDEETLERASHPQQNGWIHTDSLVLQFYGLPTDENADVRFLHVELHSRGNPYVILKTICDQQGWLAVGPNPDEPIVDFLLTIAEWEDWQRNEEQYLEEARKRQSQNHSRVIEPKVKDD